AGQDPVPSVVVAVTPGTKPVNAEQLATQFGVPLSVADADVDEQLAAATDVPSFGISDAAASPLESLLEGDAGLAFGPPETGSYEPLVPDDLDVVEEDMAVTICVSPEAGWTELEAFLAGTTSRLTVAMYQFTAPHIFKAVEAAVTPED